MCGISGILNLREAQPVELAVLEGMLETIRHRGPDEFGIYRDEQVGLASARLSIVDLAGGQQPISNEDGSLWIVYNGEVFNDRELRPTLIARGHQYATQCDTETILHLYEEYGPGFLQYLNGQWAIAIWDTRRRRLFLARDRVGVRPLFYTIHHQQLVFASEMKAILAVPGVPAAINPQALKQVFTYWSSQSPRTVFADIEELAPGHYMLVEGGHISIRPYWTLDYCEDQPRKPDAAYQEAFEALLIDATQIRLRADVPVGAYLSGGMDSSTISAIIKKYTTADLDTFSIAFTHEQYDESTFQAQMAAHLGTRHQIVRCTPEDIGRVFPQVIAHTETPILRTAPAPMFLLSALVHEHQYKVVLTGEGADEMLAGYDIFKEMAVRRFMARDVESKLRPMLLKKLYADIPGIARNNAFLAGFFGRDLQDVDSPYFSHSIRWNNTARSLRFFRDPTPSGSSEIAAPLPTNFAAWSPLAQAQYLEVTTFLSTYLLSSQGDRMAMANSVEGRFPFLDYRVIEFCNRLPADLKLRGLNEKYLLRKMARKLLPEEIWKRTKRPYRAPITHSFFSPRQPAGYVDDLLSAEALERTGYFNPAAVQKLASKARAGTQLSEMEEMALVGVLSTQLVDAQFVRGERRAHSGLPPHQVKRVDRLAPVNNRTLS